MILPTLYRLSKNGQILFWKCWTEGNIVHTEYGVVDGKAQTSSKKSLGKNIDKANETTPEEQADKDAQSLWNNRVERKYSISVADARKSVKKLPMLAEVYKPSLVKKFSGPAHAQPKYDGLRCLATWEGDEIKLISRAGKTWKHMQHIAKEIETFLPKGSMLDGELYIHELPLEELNSYVKKACPENTKVGYVIYDLPIFKDNQDLTFEERWKALTEIYKNYKPSSTPIVTKADTTILKDNKQETIDNHLSSMRSKKFEGTILRNPSGKYLFVHRTADLLKVKVWVDDEFKIIDIVSGEGKMEGHAVFICKSDLSEDTFECVMSEPMSERKEKYDNREKYIGKLLTVEYAYRTKSGLPFNPIGKSIRLEEDLS